MRLIIVPSKLRCSYGQPNSKVFWKPRKSNVVNEPSPSPSATGSPASKRLLNSSWSNVVIAPSQSRSAVQPIPLKIARASA